MSKALWFAEFERLLNEGHSYDHAGELAHGAMCDRLADMADAAKDRAKEEGRWPPSIGQAEAQRPATKLTITDK